MGTTKKKRHWFNAFEDILMIAPLAVIIVLVFLQVVLRYVFNTGILWGEEVVGFLIVLVAMIGIGVAYREKRHTDLQVFVKKAPRPLAAVLRGIGAFAEFFFLLVYLVASVVFLFSVGTQVSVTLRIPMVIPYSFLALGALSMLVEFVRRRFMREAKEATEEPQGDGISL